MPLFRLPPSTILAGATLFVLGGALACGSPGSEGGSHGTDFPSKTRDESAPVLEVVVSVPPQRWIVEEVGGTSVHVESLLGPGDSPATFQPSDADVSRILKADLFVRIGVPFEKGSWGRALSASDRLVVVDGDRDLEKLASVHTDDEHDDGAEAAYGSEALDPHVWLSPRRLETQVLTVAAAVVEQAPDLADEIATNVDRVLRDLRQLDAELAALLSPWEGQPVFVYHPSWGYLTADYGLEQHAIQEGGQDPSDVELTRLQEEVRDAGVQAIFVQPQIEGRAARAIAQATGVELVVLDPLAPDLPSNLRAAAQAFVASFTPPSSR